VARVKRRFNRVGRICYRVLEQRIQARRRVSIADAVSSKGKRYSALAKAFVYRENVTASCTCRDATSVQMSIADDLTLRPGDIVVTTEGVRILRATRQFRIRLANSLTIEMLGLDPASGAPILTLSNALTDQSQAFPLPGRSDGLRSTRLAESLFRRIAAQMIGLFVETLCSAVEIDRSASTREKAAGGQLHNQIRKLLAFRTLLFLQ
jgi:hypothetical protein